MLLWRGPATQLKGQARVKALTLEGFLPEKSRRPALAEHSAADLGAALTAASPQTRAAYRTGGPSIFQRSEIMVLAFFCMDYICEMGILTNRYHQKDAQGHPQLFAG